MRLQLIFAGAAAVVIALAGCAQPRPSLSRTPEPPVSETPATTASPSPTPEPLTLVDCEIMLPIAQARALFSAATEFLGERSPTEFGGWFPLTEIDSTLADASQVRACTWGVPNSDGVFTVHAVEVTATQRASLESALAAEGFSNVTTGTVTAFEMAGENEVSTIASTHLFTGDLWLMSNANTLSTTGPAANSALEGLRSANPTLAL